MPDALGPKDEQEGGTPTTVLWFADERLVGSDDVSSSFAQRRC
jgi:hypothetical protein